MILFTYFFGGNKDGKRNTGRSKIAWKGGVMDNPETELAYISKNELLALIVSNFIRRRQKTNS